MKFKPGEEARIKFYSTRPRYWNNIGLMDKWMGKTVTIKKMYSDGRQKKVIIEEDAGEGFTKFDGESHWVWDLRDLELANLLTDKDFEL